MNLVTGAVCVVVGAILGIAGFLLINEARNAPRLMPAAQTQAYEKWCGEDKGGQTHYNAQRHITGCTAPPKK